MWSTVVQLIYIIQLNADVDLESKKNQNIHGIFPVKINCPRSKHFQRIRSKENWFGT